MPGRRWLFRFASLSGFLVAVAIILWLADLERGVVVGVMAGAWAIAALIEWLSWRAERVRFASGPVWQRETGQVVPPDTAQVVAPDIPEQHPAAAPEGDPHVRYRPSVEREAQPKPGPEPQYPPAPLPLADEGRNEAHRPEAPTAAASPEEEAEKKKREEAEPRLEPEAEE